MARKGRYNGAYKFRRMLERFGPKRIIDTPISEMDLPALGVGPMVGLRRYHSWTFVVFVRRV